MSIFSALDTAVSGLSAQSAAFANISDNVANSQTVGFKGVDTSFIDYLTSSTATQNQSGSVATRPDYLNDVQGNIVSSNDPTALAISGQGFFAVAQASGQQVGSTPVFDTTQYYSRAGDFSPDKNGFLVNSAGEYLEGYPANATTGGFSTSALQPIQVPTTQDAPVTTTSINYSANLPAGTSTSPTETSSVEVYNSAGTAETLSINWAQSATSPGTWTGSFSLNGSTLGTATATFGSDGTLASLTGDGANVAAPTASGTGSAATLSLANVFGSGSSPVTVNLGSFGSSTNGLTQYATSTYSLNSMSANGSPPGSLNDVTIDSSGNVIANYDNNQSVTIAQIPLVTFADANALQRQNGQAFTATEASGAGVVKAVNSGGAGSLAVGSVESSNVDIATEFTKLIVAQQAYSANTKVVTTANALLQTTVNMVQ